MLQSAVCIHSSSRQFLRCSLNSSSSVESSDFVTMLRSCALTSTTASMRKHRPETCWKKGGRRSNELSFLFVGASADSLHLQANEWKAHF